MLETLIADTGPDRYPQIHQNAFQLLAQTLIFQRSWEPARKTLEQAAAVVLKDGDSYYWLIVQQWQAVLEYFTSRDPKLALRKLREIKGKFESIGRWENARACAFYAAYCSRNREELLHLYFGTPYAGFRVKILKLLGHGEDKLPEAYDYRLHGHRPGSSLLPHVESLNGQCDASAAKLKPGQLPQRLLQALASDFFSPPNIFGLHQYVYPDLHFDPIGSAEKIAQGLKRLREWLHTNRVPLEIVEQRQRYCLVAPNGLSLRVHRSSTARDADGARLADFLNQVTAAFGTRPFQSRDIQKLLKISDWSARNLVKVALEHSKLDKSGRGPATSYRVSRG